VGSRAVITRPDMISTQAEYGASEHPGRVHGHGFDASAASALLGLQTSAKGPALAGLCRMNVGVRGRMESVSGYRGWMWGWEQ
jgi:hypothetical protein